MWGMRTETIPVIIGALGAIKKGLETYLGRIPGQLSISELQKITLLGTAHILRRVLSIKLKKKNPSAPGPWFGLGPRDSKQTLCEDTNTNTNTNTNNTNTNTNTDTNNSRAKKR